MAKILLNVEIDSKKAEAGLNTLKESLTKVVKELGELKPNKDLTAQLNALARSYSAVEKAATSELRQAKEQAALEAKLAKLEADAETALKKKAKATSEVAIAAEKAAQQTEKTREATAKANIAEEKLEQQVIKTAKSLDDYGKSTEDAGQKTGFLTGSLGDTIAKFAKAEVAFLAVRTPLNMIKNALAEVDDTLIKTEDAVIEVQRVLDETVPAGEISNRLYSIAYEYGSTFENASQIAVNFARAGRTWNESLEATEAALLAMNVAELNATEASDGLLSILAQFGMETSELTNVVDKLNKTADKNPVSTQKLLQAIQRSGSAAKNANVSFDQTLGLITAISEATNRGGQNIGTAINSLIQYSQKNVDVFAQLSDESAAVVERFKLGLSSIVDVWNQVSIDIKNDKTARDNIISALGTDGLEELSSTLHDELGDLVTEIDGVYNVANTYRKNYFIALLDNMDRFMDVQAQLTDFQGYSQEENAKYLETYNAKLNQLRDAWQKLANDEQGILSFKKSLVEIGIELVNTIEESGGLVTVISEIVSAIAGIALVANAKKWSDAIQGVGNTLHAVFVEANVSMSSALGLAGLVLVAITAITSAVNGYRAHQKKLREESIEWFETNKDNVVQLNKLKEKLDDLNPASGEYRDVESQIVELLGDKAVVLQGLSSDTERYTELVKQLTEAELAEYRQRTINAKEAASQSFRDAANGNGRFAAHFTADTGIANGTAEQYANYFITFQEKVDASFKKWQDSIGNASKRESERLHKIWQTQYEILQEITPEYESYVATLRSLNTVLDENGESYLFSAEKITILSDAVENLHTVGRAGVVPTLKETKTATDDLADSSEELSEKIENTEEDLGDLYLLTEETQQSAQELTETIKDLSTQIDETQNAIKVLTNAQAEYDEYGSLSIDTLQSLIGLGGEYLDLIIDEEGQIRLNEDAVNGLISAKQDLIQELIAQQVQEYAVNKLHEYMEQSTSDMGDEAVLAAQKIELAALALSHFEGNEEGAKRAAEDFEEALHRLALHEGVLGADWEENWVNDVKNFRSGLTSLYSRTDTSGSSWSGRSTSSSGSSSSSTKDPKLESLKDAVALRESELTLMEHQGASQDQQIAKIKQIQAALAEQADYMRSIGASQTDINKLSSEWWKWQEKINKFAEENAKAAEKAAEEQKKAQEEAKKAAEEAVKAETARLKQVVADDKARLTLMEKQGKSVAERVDQMKAIQNHLHDEAEWLRKIGATQAEIDALSAEWWDWQEKILKLYKETLETARELELKEVNEIIDSILNEIDLKKEELALDEKRLAVTEAEANLQEAIKQARIDYVRGVLSDYIQGLSDAKTLEEKQNAVIEAREKLMSAEREARSKAIIDSFNAEKEGKSSVLSLEERILAVRKAEEALRSAQENRTTRVYNESSGQWEYQADAGAVQSAQDNLKSAVDALNAFVEEQAWNEVAEAVENGSVTEAEVAEILEKWAKESYGEGSPEFIQKITSAYRKAMGTSANPETVSGQISAVDSAVESLNSYLKQEAVKELEKYIADGNTSASGMKSILDKWLSLGEGGELYEWRDGLLREVNGAIRSGYYDDSKVDSSVRAVESAVEALHDYIRDRFISQVSDLVKNGTAEQLRDFIDSQSRLYEDEDLPLGWANDLYNNVSRRQQINDQYDHLYNGNLTSDEFQMWIQRMQANSAAWWTTTGEERKQLEATNMAIGQMLGLIKGHDGAWYFPDGTRVYDGGGVLDGIGGIKATRRKEMILDPDLTAKILKPQSEAAFKAFTDAMNILFERGGRSPLGGWSRNGGYSDSHNVSNVINGIPISPSMAETHTIAELCRLLPIVGRA